MLEPRAAKQHHALNLASSIKPASEISVSQSGRQRSKPAWLEEAETDKPATSRVQQRKPYVNAPGQQRKAEVGEERHNRRKKGGLPQAGLMRLSRGSALRLSA